MDCVFHRMRFEGKIADLSFPVSSVEFHSVFFGQLSEVTLATICLPSSESGGFVTGSTSVAVTFCCPHAASQPCPVLLELSTPWPWPLLSTGPRCTEELGLPAAPKPSTNTLVYPGEGELAVQSSVEYGSRLH